MNSENNTHSIHTEEVKDVVIRFAGDSGDGMQLTGTQFTTTSANIGNDISTFPDFPAEIRAPAGSLAGVSSFQLNFSSQSINTPGDDPQVLVAMNPAALLVHYKDVPAGGMIIVNKDAFNERNLERAGYVGNPLEDGLLDSYKVHEIPIGTLNQNALKELDLSSKDKDRCKNFFALGLLYWLYDRPLNITLDWIQSKFKKNKAIVEANSTSLKSGYYYGETAEAIPVRFKIGAAKTEPGTYRNITGNQALSYGLAAAHERSQGKLIYCSYPITPASDILHELSKLKNLGIKTVQFEDEIAAIGGTIGAAFGGAIGITGTSGPGLALKGEAAGLAVITELPLVIINVQRGGPSTGLPTKVEQSDLLQAFYGRNGECPMIILAAASPSDCFIMAYEAVRLAIKYMTPVILLSDGYIANSSEPWEIPLVEDLEEIKISYAPASSETEKFLPYKRDDKTLARQWAIPGTIGNEHRIGGLEKSKDEGNVSYDPLNHEYMVKTRAEKVERVTDSIAKLEVEGPETGDLLLVGWGGTLGAISTAAKQLRAEGLSVANVHIRHMNPFPKDLEKILKSYKKIVVPELNLGQLTGLLRAKYLVDAQCFSKVQGKPFKVSEIVEFAKKLG